MEERIVNFRDLSKEDRERLRITANWQVNGEIGDWDTVVDKRYGTIQHIAITDENGTVKFDKLNILWTSGVYVVAVRVNPDGKAEFLLPSEKRILLRNKDGQQGNEFVDGIPQGVIREWQNELPHKAALRELMEETGYAPNSLVFLGNIAFSPANSEIEQPYYLAHVPYLQTAKAQTLEESETIHADEKRWLTWDQIQARPLRDGITVIGLALAQRVLKPELL